MEDALAKIRPHSSSPLDHQKRPAILLLALESTFKEHNTEASATAYFAALLTALDGTIGKNDTSLEEGAILPAELYLLALISPFVATHVIRSNLNILLTLTGPLWPLLLDHAPALRSQLTLYHSLFRSLDRSQLEVQGVRQTFASVLAICVDRRPKVRKKANDVVKDMLLSPPPPLLLHPYADRVSDWFVSMLSDANATSNSKYVSMGSEGAIHTLSFLKPLVHSLPSKSLPVITNLLLRLPQMGNNYLSQSSYTLLSDIFQTPVENLFPDMGERLTEVLKVVLSSPPSKTDSILVSGWVHLLGSILVAYSNLEPTGFSKHLGKVWKNAWNFMDSSDLSIRKSTAESLSAICNCFAPQLIEAAVLDKDGSSPIRKITSQVAKSLDALPYARSIPEILPVLSSLITNLKYRSSKASPTAAEILLMPAIISVGNMRISKHFEFKEAADATLSVAMRILGPAVLLDVLPLNLEPSKRASNAEPRAFLLPLLAQPHATSLSHFVSYFVPLSETMFDLQQKAETEGRHSEAKVWSVLVGQVWAGLSGYCIGTADLKSCLTAEFSQLLSRLLYGQPSLRPSILKALKSLVDSNFTSETTFPYALSQEEVRENIAFLSTQAESWLAVLFNVYGSVGQDSRVLIGEVISSWTSITRQQELHSAYAKVVQLFETNLPASETGNSDIVGHTINMNTTSQDIFLLLLSNLCSSDCESLFSLCLKPEILACKDKGVQKRGYKILTKIVKSEKIPVNAVVVLQKLDTLTDGLNPAAKKDRFNLLAALIALLPKEALHLIPSLIPEVVLGTKESSEKTRTASFDVVVAMGQRMASGGIVRRSLVDGMDEDGMEDADANIDEFMTMVGGGLSFSSAHMVSATVTAISRLVYEFKDAISPNMHREIFTSLLVFLSSTNREIVKSILGFVKLALHTLPVNVIQPHLGELVPALLKWSHHKNHFKLKVRHIFERMMRRFAWDDIYASAADDDLGKVLINIKKSKEKMKRRKAEKAGQDFQEETLRAKETGDAFEDVLYGSESELVDSDDEQPEVASGSKKTASQGLSLLLDNNEPMDLLEGAASRFKQVRNIPKRKPGQDASYFNTDETTGKMIINSDSDSEQDISGSHDVADDAYKESIESVDSFTRGPNGRIKFNKDTKKRRREDGDVEMEDIEYQTTKSKKSKKKAPFKFGQEFKAKKAGGDVKKGGVDPYAYMSLSEAVGRGKKTGIIGKK